MSRPGLLSSLRGFGATGVALLRTRLALLRIEAEEEVLRVTGLLAWGLAAVLLGVAGAVFLAVFLTVLFWESQRLLVLGIFAALFIAAALGAFLFARHLASRGSLLFAASLAELRRDEDTLANRPGGEA